MKEVLAYSLGIVAVLLFFLPWFLGSSGHIPSTYPDAWAFLWSLDRLSYVWSGEETLYFTDRVFHPFGAGLALHTQAEGVLFPASLFTTSSNRELIYTLVVVLCFVLNFLSFALLFTYLSNRTPIGVWLGLALTLHPQFVGHLDGGHLNFLCFFPVAFWLRSFLIIVHEEAPIGKHLGILVFSAMFLGFTNLYYLFFLGLLAVLLSLFFIGSGTMRAIQGVILSGFMSLFGLMIAAGKLALVFDAYHGGGFRANHAPAEHSADLLFFFIPSVNQLIGHISKYALNPFMFGLSNVELGVYMGVGLTLLVVYAFTRRVTDPLVFTFFTVGLFFMILSLGPEVRITGALLVEDPLYEVLQKMPLFPSVPIRFGFIAVLLFCCTVAVGLKVELNKLSLVLLLLLGVEFLPRGLPLGKLPQSVALEELAKRDEVKALHDFSVGRQHKLAHQLIHGKKVTSAFLARTPLDPVLFYKENAFLGYVRRGREASKKELSDAISNLKIEAVLCEWGKPKCAERVLATGKFEKLREDDYLTVLVLKEL